MFPNNLSDNYRDSYQTSSGVDLILGKRGLKVFIFLVSILFVVSFVGYSIDSATLDAILTFVDAALGDTIFSEATTPILTLAKTSSNSPLSTATFDQNAFRIRTDDSAGLNTDSDWAGQLNENVSLWPDTEFRIRLEVEAAGGLASDGFELWYSRDGSAYTIVPNNGTPHAAGSIDGQKTVQAVPSAQYNDLDATINLLDGSIDPFVAGTGNHDNSAPAVSFSSPSHVELEWTIIIRKLYDDQGHNPDGTTFDFRIRKTGGVELDTYTNTPRITVLNKPGHIGGTVIETPMRYFVKDNVGNLYYLCEYADTSNTAVMMKSTDGGTSWNPVDVIGAPSSGDLEAADMDLRGNTIYIALQGPGSAETVAHHRFNVSTHPTNPDKWAFIDEEVVTAPNPINQSTAIVQRSSSTVIAYRGDPISAREQIYYRIRSGDLWGSELQLDSEPGMDFLGIGMVRDSSDKIHFVYTASDGINGYIFFRTLSNDNSLGIRQTIHTEAGLQSKDDKVYKTPPMVWNDGGIERIGVGFRKESDFLYFRSWNANTEVLDPEQPVSDNMIVPGGADSRAIVADIRADDITDDLYALYAEDNTGDMFYDTRLEGGDWGSDIEEQDNVNVDWIRADVFTHSGANGGARVLGYIWDDGSEGGVGKTRYNEKVIAEAASPFRFVSWADTKSALVELSTLSDQASLLNPDFTIYPGDLESLGFTETGIAAWKAAMDGELTGDPAPNGMFDITFPVRGNHDQDNTLGWQAYFDFQDTGNFVGVTNYANMSGEEDLTYSFDYANSHFIGVDVIGSSSAISSTQIAWIDADLTAAESRGQTHGFIYFHGPIYCVDGHCSCTETACPLDSSVEELVSMMNRHPIITATFHGHEHTYAYTYIDERRIPPDGLFEGVTHPFRQFITGSAGAGPTICDPALRCDYNMPKDGFVTVDVEGIAVTVTFYQIGSMEPVNTIGFIKDGVITNTPPIADDDSATTSKDTSIHIDVADNDSDIDGNLDPSSAVRTSGPTRGVLVNNGDGTFVYTPEPGFSGNDGFLYQICDMGGLCDTATVSITVFPSAFPIPEVDSVSTGRTNASSLTIPHTTSGFDRLMLVGVSINNDDLEMVSSITYNGVPLTYESSETQNDDARVEVWKLVAPPTGSHNVEITFSSALRRYAVAGVITFTGVDQTDPLGTFSGNNATSGTASVTVPSGANDQVLGVFSCEMCTSVTFSGPALQQWNITMDGGIEIGAGMTVPGANPQVAISATLGSSDHWVMGGISIKPVPAPSNNPPVANDDSAITLEDMGVTIDVAANDSDPEGALDPGSATTTCTGCANPSHGLLVNHGDGTFGYTPQPDYHGPDSFVYQICDGFSACDTATVTITVNPVPDPPIANDDSASTSEDTPVHIDVADNDSDIDGDLDPSSAVRTSGPTHGVLVNHGDGSFMYTPDLDYNGSDSFGYQICDLEGLCDTAMVSITITPPNAPPVAVDDSAATSEDVGLTIDVAANDSDPEGDLDPGSANTTCTGCSNPTNGILVNHGDGGFGYTPQPDYNGTDSFVYQICDGFSACDTATVTITVDPVPDPPVAVDDSAATSEDTPVTIDVAANDSDIDGDLDPSSAVRTSGPTHGVLVNNGNGTYVYTPEPGFSGDDSFLYQICDTGGLCDTASVSITVISSAPVLPEVDSVSTGSTNASSLTIPHTTSGFDRLMLVGVSINNDGLEMVSSITYNGIPLIYESSETQSDDARIEIWKLVAPPTGSHNVEITFSSALRRYAVVGVITFTGVDQTDPLGIFAGNNATSSTASVTVPSGANDLVLGVFSCETCTSVTFSGPALQQWNITMDSGIEIGAGMTVPGADPQVTISATLGSSDHWVMGGISIKPVLAPSNNPPVANDDSAITLEDMGVTIDVAANDSDPEGALDPSSANTTCAGCANPSHGLLVNHGDGTFGYTPQPDYNGSDSFVYQICDSNSACDTATVTITVDPVPDPPIANDDSASTSEDTSVHIDVAANDSDIDGDLDPSSAVQTSGPAHGVLVNNGDGTFGYTPHPDYNGTDSFVYQICDSKSACDTGTVTITVDPVLDPPVAVDDSAATSEDMGVTIDVAVNDNDIDGDLDPSSAVRTSGPTHGVLVNNGDGTFGYTPQPDYHGPDSFVYQICDSNSACDTATVTITVDPVPDPPVAVDDSTATSEDMPVSIDVAANDSDIDGDLDPSSAVQASEPAHGILVNNGDGTFVYTPDLDYSGSDSFVYQICDLEGLCDTAMVSITITPPNAPPVAVDDSAATSEDMGVTIDVAANDSDPEGDLDPGSANTTCTGCSNPTNGILVNHGDGSFGYTPQPDYNGTDSFVYQICDGFSACDTATVTIRVDPVPDPPVAVDDSAATSEDTPVTIDVAANDSDIDGDLDPSSAVQTSEPAHGVLVNNGDGTFMYTPDLDYNGSDSFAYQICDLDGLCDMATVTITVEPVPDPPVAVDDSAATLEDMPVTIDVAANDSDIDGNLDPSSAVQTSEPAHGVLVNNGDGTFVYTPDLDYNSSDSFVYQICDLEGLCDTALVTITVEPVPDPPVALDDSAATSEDMPVTIDVAANDSDIDGDLDPSSAVRTSEPAHGVLVNHGDGTFMYTPDLDYNGSDSFVYQICDLEGSCDTALVTITVEPVPDPPVALDDSAATSEDMPVTIDVAANDSDIDGDLDPSSAVWTNEPAHGALVNNGDGSFVYTPDPGFSGDDSFLYQICDTGALCDTASVSITVIPSVLAMPEVDAVSTRSTNASSLTISHTTSGLDRLMLVGVSINNDDNETVSSITYNGVPLTYESSETQSDDARVEIWKLVAPPTGSHNVEITFSSALRRYAVVGVITFTGVDQTNPLGTFVGNSATSSSVSLKVLSGANDMVLGVFSCELCKSVTFSVSAEQQWNLSERGGQVMGVGTTLQGADPQVTISATLGGSDPWAMGGISIKPSR